MHDQEIILAKMLLEVIYFYNKVYNRKFNIYQCINRVKKELKWEKSRHFPAEVIIRVCVSYFRSDIRCDYVWFVKTLKSESAKHFASMNVTQNEVFKKEEPMSLKEILERAMSEKI